MGRTRSQAERDAATVEVGYALASAGFLGAVVFGAVAGPAAVWDLPSGVDRSLLLSGAAVGGVLALFRVWHVLRRYTRRRRGTPDSPF